MKLISLFFCLLFLSASSQTDYMDTKKQNKTNVFGVEANFSYVDLGSGSPLWQNTLGVYYQSNFLYAGIGCSYTSQTTVSNLSYVKRNLLGPSGSLGLNLYKFKEIITVPVIFGCHYYNYNFREDNGVKSQYTLVSYATKIGITYKPRSVKLVVFANGGVAFISGKTSYIEFNGQENIRKVYFLSKNLEFGLRYILFSK
jgi:hypothetical protein